MTKYRMKPQPKLLEEAIKQPCPVVEFARELDKLSKKGLTHLHTTGRLKGYVAPCTPPNGVPVRHGKFWYWEVDE